MRNVVDFLTGNLILNLSILAWAMAQIIKFVITLITKGKLDWRHILSSGGMPSSHSATVCSLVMAAARLYGPDSAIFALAFIMAIIVMYDAMGVRRETGEQAKVLNRLLNEWMDQESEFLPFLGDKKLKEMVGHTPIQVWTGAAFGAAIGFAMPMV